jgi:hypothetical protein
MTLRQAILRVLLFFTAVVILTVFHTHSLIDYRRYILLAIDGVVKYNAISLGVRKLTKVLLFLIRIGTDPSTRTV